MSKRRRHGRTIARMLLAGAGAFTPSPSAATAACPDSITIETADGPYTGSLIDEIITIDGASLGYRIPFIHFGQDGLYQMDDGRRIRIEC